MTPFEVSMQFFAQLALILAVCRLTGLVARYFGQPQVVAEMIAGVLMGPSVFGLFAPEWQQAMFPPATKSVIFSVCQVGLSLYMFLVGLEFRVDLFQAKARSAAAVSIAGMAVPFILGGLLALLFLRQGGFFNERVSTAEGVLFLGASMCITAFPMLARIIFERGLSGTTLGTLALAAGAMDDAAAWCLLAIVLASFESDPSIAVWAIGGGVTYAVVVLTIVRWALAPIGRRVEASGEVTPMLLSGTLMLVMLGSYLTDIIGIYAVFGAFLMGCAMPRGKFAELVTKQVEPLVTTLLLPVFFIYSGLNTRLDLVTTPELWVAAILVLLAACVGKGVACWAAARLTGADSPTAMAVGTLMNARGLMELIILNIGLERGIISPQLFSIMVVMAIVTTLMASPLFELVYGRAARRRGELAQLQGA